MNVVAPIVAGGAGLALVLGVAAALPAQAGGGSVTLPADGVLEQRLERFCDRAPELAERAAKVQPRLAADAETRGSLKRLEARLAEAKAEDRQRRARVLERRLERRRELSQRLPERLATLEQARQECATAGVGS